MSWSLGWVELRGDVRMGTMGVIASFENRTNFSSVRRNFLRTIEMSENMILKRVSII